MTKPANLAQLRRGGAIERAMRQMDYGWDDPSQYTYHDQNDGSVLELTLLELTMVVAALEEGSNDYEELVPAISRFEEFPKQDYGEKRQLWGVSLSPKGVVEASMALDARIESDYEDGPELETAMKNARYILDAYGRVHGWSPQTVQKVLGLRDPEDPFVAL